MRPMGVTVGAVLMFWAVGSSEAGPLAMVTVPGSFQRGMRIGDPHFPPQNRD